MKNIFGQKNHLKWAKISLKLMYIFTSGAKVYFQPLKKTKYANFTTLHAFLGIN